TVVPGRGRIRTSNRGNRSHADESATAHRGCLRVVRGDLDLVLRSRAGCAGAGRGPAHGVADAEGLGLRAGHRRDAVLDDPEGRATTAARQPSAAPGARTGLARAGDGDGRAPPGDRSSLRA